MGRGHVSGKCCKKTSSRVSWLCVASWFQQMALWSLAWVYGLPGFVTKRAICSTRATNCACLFSNANSLKIVWNTRRSSRRSKTLRSTTTGSFSSINIINIIISFLIDPNQSELHHGYHVDFFLMQEREEFWSLFEIGWNADSVAWTRYTAVCEVAVILSQLHVSATRPCLISPECVHHKILPLLHVAAICPLVFSPLKGTLFLVTH